MPGVPGAVCGCQPASARPPLYTPEFPLTGNTPLRPICLIPNRFSAGAIFSAGRSTLSIGRSTIFTGNAAQSQGGAIFFDEPNEVNVSDVVFTSNTADCGGAIYMASPAYSSVREYRNCMFEDNTATNGGAIYLYDEAGLDIVNGSTFYGNYASKLLRRKRFAIVLRQTCTTKYYFWQVDRTVRNLSSSCCRAGWRKN